MSFLRQPQPAPPPITISIDAAVERHIAQLIAEAMPAREPFCIVVNCPQSPTGMHQAIFDCGDIVCPHCATVLP